MTRFAFAHISNTKKTARGAPHGLYGGASIFTEHRLRGGTYQLPRNILSAYGIVQCSRHPLDHLAHLDPHFRLGCGLKARCSGRETI